MNENNINKIEKYKFLLRLDHSILREVLRERERKNKNFYGEMNIWKEINKSTIKFSTTFFLFLIRTLSKISSSYFPFCTFLFRILRKKENKSLKKSINKLL